MAYTSYQNSDNIVPYYQALVADTESDVADLPTDCAPGSTCLVVGGSSLWIFGNDNEWHKLTKDY